MSSASNESDHHLPKTEGTFEDSNNGDDGSWPSPHGHEENEPQTVPIPSTEGKNAEPEPQRHYPPRMCRICLETILPTYENAQDGIGGLMAPKPRVSYVSSDPAAGRLIRPCKCKGSSRYVHEGCLQAWRHADRRYSRRNYFECPTCGFRYQLERMRYARWITSPVTQIFLTIIIMVAVLFVSGFFTDLIIALVVGPIEPLDEVPDELQDLYNAPWTIHFIKGMLSIGVFSFAKLLWASSPFWNLQQIRLPGVGGGRRGGRERIEYITITLIIVGFVTVMMAVWEFVRKWSRRGLERAGERVADVQGDDDDFEEESVVTQTSAQATTSPETRKTQ